MRTINLTNDFAQLVTEYIASTPEMCMDVCEFELVRTEFDAETSDLDELEYLIGFDIVVPEDEETELVIGYAEVDLDFNLFVDIFE